MDQSYFPSNNWQSLGERHYICTGTIAYHNIDGRGSISQTEAVFLRDHMGFSPIYRGENARKTMTKVIAWVGDNPSGNLFARLRGVNWDSFDITETA